MENLTLDWIAGFVDGKDSFNLRMSGSQQKRYPNFNISNADKQILEEIRDYFGFGHVEHARYQIMNKKASWQYVVTNREELLKLADLIHPKLRSETEKEQFKIWLDGFQVYKNP